MAEDAVFIEVKKLGLNSRRICCRVAIAASLDEVWRVLTDYERMVEFLPYLAVSKIVEKRENFYRVSQVALQNLVLGLKMNAKTTMEYHERDVEVFDSGKRRYVDVKMVEGDFQVYEAKWSVEQMNKRAGEEDDSETHEEGKTTLSYVLDVKTKLWLPIQLIEGRLSKALLDTHSCIRDKVMENKAVAW